MTDSGEEKAVIRMALRANTPGALFAQQIAKSENISTKATVEAMLDAWAASMIARTAEDVAGQIGALPKDAPLNISELLTKVESGEECDELNLAFVNRKAPILAETLYRAQHQYQKAKAETGRSNVQKRWKS